MIFFAQIRCHCLIYIKRPHRFIWNRTFSKFTLPITHSRNSKSRQKLTINKWITKCISFLCSLQSLFFNQPWFVIIWILYSWYFIIETWHIFNVDEFFHATERWLIYPRVVETFTIHFDKSVTNNQTLYSKFLIKTFYVAGKKDEKKLNYYFVYFRREYLLGI